MEIKHHDTIQGGNAMSGDLFQQGVEAFQAGDKARAKELLLQATAQNPNHDNAWYYLAAAEPDITLRRQYLERVLQINPNHERARQVMAKFEGQVDAAPAAAQPVPPPPRPAPAAEPVYSAPPVSTVPPATPIRPLDPSAGEAPGSAAGGGFMLPVSIPGAPTRVSIGSLFGGGWQLFQRGLDVLQRKAGAYEAEVARATWWRFWLLVAFGYAINAILSTVSALLIQAQFSSFGFRFDFLEVLLALLLTIPIGMITLYAGVYVSHWWAKRQGGLLPLYQHAYAVALPYIPAYVIGMIISVVFSFVGFGGGLIPLIVSLYALYVMALGFENLYRFGDSNQKYFTVGMMFVGFIVAGFLIGVVTTAVFGFSTFVLG
jgi:hypothetical protein